MKKFVSLLILLVIFGGGGYICFEYYPYVFAKSVQGEILKVERVTTAEAIITSGRPIPAEQMFSFAVAIRGDDGEIHTASSEDRQWAVVQAGQCAAAKFFPYPPWQVDKAGTYYGARLLHLYDCPGKMPITAQSPAAPAAAPPAAASPAIAAPSGAPAPSASGAGH